MFLNSDFNTFVSNWIDYNAVYNQKISGEQAQFLFESIKDFAPCTILQFTSQLKRSVYLSSKVIPIQELMELASFDGRTKEQAKANASRLYRILLNNQTDYSDYCFADHRACIAFYLCFGSISNFLRLSEKDKTENYTCKRFIDNYINCSLNDNLEIINQFTFYRGWQNVTPRQVIPIGDDKDVIFLCDHKYGVNNWGLWREDLVKQNLESFHKLYADVPSAEVLQKKQIDLMKEIIEYQKKNLLLGCIK